MDNFFSLLSFTRDLHIAEPENWETTVSSRGADELHATVKSAYTNVLWLNNERSLIRTFSSSASSRNNARALYFNLDQIVQGVDTNTKYLCWENDRRVADKSDSLHLP